MKKKVFDYIESHPHCSAKEIIQSLNLSGIDVLKAISELENDSCLKRDPPVEISNDNNNSVHYSTTGKPLPTNKQRQ